MSLLKKLFGKKNDPASDAEASAGNRTAPATPDPAETELEQHFDEEWSNALTRFGVVTGVGTINFDLKHPQTQQPISPHLGLGGTFTEWQEIRSPYDRRRLLFDLLFSMMQDHLNVWHTANYLVAVRSPDKALRLLEESPPPVAGDEGHAGHCAAFARALLAITRHAEAVPWARQAVAGEPDGGHFQTLLADALHMGEGREEAHEIYTRLMATGKGSDNDGVAVVEEMFHNLFARETGVMPSPVMAVELAESMGDASQAEDFWLRGETEFYDSPYFRMRHAYYLANAGAMEQSFAKLLTLVQEMPWVKEASLNLLKYFEHFATSGHDLMPEFRAELGHRIEENGWTTEGMRDLTVGVPRA